MTLFWLYASGLLLISIFVISRTILAKGNSLKKNNDDIYKQKLKEINIDIENQLISPKEAENAIHELENLIKKDTSNTNLKNSKLYTSTRLSKKIISISTLFLVPVFVLSIYNSIGNPNAIDRTRFGQNLENSIDSDVQLTSVEEMLKRVEKRLIDEPDNVDDWLILANSYVVLKRYIDAVRAFENVYRLKGDEPALLFRYADVLAMSNSGIFKGKPAELINKGLKLDSENTMGLWLAGLAAYEEDKIIDAIDYWQKVLPKLEEGSEDAKNIKNYIEFAAKENNISLDNSNVKLNDSKKYSIKLNIQLSQNFNTVDQNNTVFIYAKPIDSNIKMPIVVLRKKVSDLPLELSMDDSMSMLPNNKLSDYESVIVSARVSKSGNAKSEKGDLIGTSSHISTSSKEIIRININSTIE